MGRPALMMLLCACAAGAQNPVRDNTVQPVALMRCQQPRFTEEALVAHLAGQVTMSLTIDDDGRPHDIHVVSPLGLGLDESAVSCMGQSRYYPAEKDGKPVPLKMDVSLGFQDHWDSNWRLGKVAFQMPEGVSRPIFIKADYPAASADKRGATVCIHLTVDTAGNPTGVQLAVASQDAKLDKEAVSIAGGFRFQTGSKGGRPVAVPATLTLVHGAANTSLPHGR
jgi:TonB family protein